MREVCVWRPKREAQEACISEASPLKCDVQQREVRVSSQRHETYVSKIERGTQRVYVSQMSLVECDNQQREVHVSYPRKHETRVSKSKRESRISSAKCELHISEPCVSGL